MPGFAGRQGDALEAFQLDFRPRHLGRRIADVNLGRLAARALAGRPEIDPGRVAVIGRSALDDGNPALESYTRR